MKHVLVIPNDVVGPRMSGPGVRAWELACALARWDGGRAFAVTLAAPPHVAQGSWPDGAPAGMRLRALGAAGLHAAAQAADVVLTQGHVLRRYPWLLALCRALALDVYDPFVLEDLACAGEDAWQRHAAALDGLNAQLRAGDYFVCASETQRDYWLGMLTALDRVNPATYDADASLRRLIGVVPFGVPSAAPLATRRALKGVHAGIAPHDRVILWHGGIWNWLDPFTLLRAMARIAERRADVRLFFMGVRPPGDPAPEALESAARAERLADELGLLGRCVFFNDWTDYADRVNYLLEADAGVMTYGDHVETRFAYRTRMLDAIWAGLPTVCTRGDALAALVEQRGLGYTVPAGDAGALEAALLRLLDEPDARGRRAARFSALAEAFAWDRVVEPLAGYCAQALPAADRALRRVPGAQDAPMPAATPAWELPGRALTHLLRGGPAGLAREVRAYLRWNRS